MIFDPNQRVNLGVVTLVHLPPIFVKRLGWEIQVEKVIIVELALFQPVVVVLI